MALPRKGTRVFALANGQTFLCHLKPDWHYDYSKHWLAIREEGARGQLLLVDLRAHRFGPSKKTVRNAIRTAYRCGWTPDAGASPLCLRSTGVEFLPIPEHEGIGNRAASSAEGRARGG